jgi:sigma-B regulation protein RsbU (phosphoserine phosphatase)
VERIRIRFQRGNDRRVAHVPVLHERRASARDRRRPDLGWSPLFNGAHADDILEAVNEQEILLLEPGEVLLQPGDMNDAIYLLLAGRLGVYIGNSGDADSAIPVQPGECLGELSAIDNQPISALVKVMEPARVLRLTQDVFWNRLMAVPGVAKNLLGVLAQRMRRNTETMLAAQRRQLELDHLSKELDVARQLQLGMLPLQQSLFPDRHEIDIAGVMEASGSVGGDLFDAFFIDDDRLFFCVGDVSGHGISAAMFMARIVGLLRIAAFNVDTPGELLTLVNDQLCAGNDANLFVTLFCGVMDTASGHIEFSNAGHLPPLISHQGRIDALPLPKGAVMGVIPGYSYPNAQCQLHEGDIMLCYTDGITEAHSSTGEEFAEARLHELVQGLSDLPLEQVLQAVRAAVQAFTGDMYFEDDFTMLALRRTVQAGN